ncbi:MAG: hypothetical protein U1E56_02320 [Bauldia sp.]
MSNDKQAEFAKIIQRIVALDEGWMSEDAKTSEAARGALVDIGKEMAAWASRHGVALIKHSVESAGDPQVRRRCALVTTTIKNGKIYMCYLEAREGRHCYYSCAPATFTPA